MDREVADFILQAMHCQEPYYVAVLLQVKDSFTHSTYFMLVV